MKLNEIQKLFTQLIKLKKIKIFFFSSGYIYCQIITKHKTLLFLTDYSHHNSVIYAQKHGLHSPSSLRSHCLHLTCAIHSQLLWTLLSVQTLSFQIKLLYEAGASKTAMEKSDTKGIMFG